MKNQVIGDCPNLEDSE